MKRLIAILLVLNIICLLLCGCDSTNNSSDISSDTVLYQDGDDVVDKTDYYKLIYNKNTSMYKYEIYNIYGKVIDSDSIVKKPHITLVDDNVVWLWVQAGTGHLTRWTYFYDVISGEKSPVYYGMTDCYDKYVLNVTDNAVNVSEMFSGNRREMFYDFEKGLAEDVIESITSAKFVDNGYSVEVEYLSAEGTPEIQTFDFKCDLQMRLTEEIDRARSVEFETAFSTADMAYVNQKYADMWQDVANKYYEKIMNYNGIIQPSENYYTSDDLHTFVSNMKNNWEQYYKIESENYLKTLQTIYQCGTVTGTIISSYHYNMQKEWALRIVDIYEQLY